ncbi:MAG: hypothetical protein K9K76_09780 [Halanaerobiales bacterium]|nr:hypothetical protein [Halanaerobiales bacterium]
MSVTGFNRMRRRLAKEKEKKEKVEVKTFKPDKKEIDYTEEVKKYHTGGGWYDLPGIEDNKRKEEAIEILKESDK